MHIVWTQEGTGSPGKKEKKEYDQQLNDVKHLQFMGAFDMPTLSAEGPYLCIYCTLLQDEESKNTSAISPQQAP